MLTGTPFTDSMYSPALHLIRPLMVALASVMYWVTPGFSQSMATTPTERPNQVSVGAFLGNIFDEHTVRGIFIENRFRQPLPLGLRCQVALYATSEASLYVDAGLVKSWNMRGWVLSLSSNMGVIRTHHSNTLGCPVEFLSYIELSRRLSRSKAISVALGHISNAHLAEKNPGTEILRLAFRL